MNAPPDGQVWRKAFFQLVPTQGRDPDLPSGSKNASDPVGISLKKGASGARQ